MPTIFLIIALPVLLSLGNWQIQRHHWKTALLSELAETSSQPSEDLGEGPIPASYQFQHVSVYLQCPKQNPGAQAGRNLHDQTGYAYTLSCHAKTQQMKVLIGWAAHPNEVESINLTALEQPWQAQGIVVETATANPPMAFVLTDAIAPLEAVAPPSIDTLPNNHLFYAIQWFAFAAILLIIYLVYLWRWRHNAKLAPPASEG